MRLGLTTFFSLALLLAAAPGVASDVAVKPAAPTPIAKAIPGLQVVKEELAAEEDLKKALPEALRRPNILRALRLRKPVTEETFSPTQGAENAPITLVEFNDLSCLQCRESAKLADSLFAKYPLTIRRVYRYAPFDRKASTNMAEFYGKLAHQQGMFWAFRAKLLEVTDFTPETLGKLLSESGVNTRVLRQDFFPNARLFYNQLDMDAEFAKELKIKTPPQLYLAGMKIGEDLKPEDIDAMIGFLTQPKGKAVLKHYDEVMHE